jgi:hypothetical protein
MRSVLRYVNVCLEKPVLHEQINAVYFLTFISAKTNWHLAIYPCLGMPPQLTLEPIRLHDAVFKNRDNALSFFWPRQWT